jgi:uncharacterized protein (UPF0261 family)
MHGMATIALLGTCDTKLEELLFLREQIESFDNVKVTLIDVGRSATNHKDIDITQQEVVSEFADTQANLQELPRGEVIKYMSSCATQCLASLHAAYAIHGVIAAGGSGGTSLVSAAMRNALPIGFPKLIVSTIASGDTGPIVEETDITLMYSVVDVAGLNELLRKILRNAAGAITGMAKAFYAAQECDKSSSAEQPRKKRVGITMFGVTTPCVDAMRRHLETKYSGLVECYVFHATGHGGRAMERLVTDGDLDAVLDLTTTEICDFLTDGNMSAGPHRLEAAARAGIPNIISLGATDMSNYGPKSTVPERYKGRLLFEHNPVVTLMRTSKDECVQIADFIVEKLKACAKSQEVIEVWIPRGGVSVLSVPGADFADKEADEALFSTLKQGLHGTGIKVVDDARPINDESFAQDISESLARLMGLK